MKSLRSTHQTAHENAIQALKTAIVEGATFDYERLVNAAIRAGVSDQELDVVIHDALEMLFYSEEHPVTRRELARSSWPLEPTQQPA